MGGARRIDFEPERRCSDWQFFLHPSARWARPGANLLRSDLQRRCYIFRAKPVSDGLPGDHVPREGRRRLPHWNRRHDITQLADWPSDEHCFTRSAETIGFSRVIGEQEAKVKRAETWRWGRLPQEIPYQDSSSAIGLPYILAKLARRWIVGGCPFVSIADRTLSDTAKRRSPRPLRNSWL